MSLLKKAYNFIKESKGPVTAKGKLIDYKEAHAIQYNFMKGLFTLDPRKLMEDVNALYQDKQQWEDSEGQYQDYALVGGYMTSKMFVGGLGTGIMTSTGIC